MQVCWLLWQQVLSVPGGVIQAGVGEGTIRTGWKVCGRKSGRQLGGGVEVVRGFVKSGEDNHTFHWVHINGYF